MTIPRTPLSLLRALLTGGLIAFFIVGGIVNIIEPESVRADYARWGYPDWFHDLTGAIEILTAALLASPRTRDLGRVSGAFVMLAALASLLAFREFPHAVAPALVLTALTLGQYLDSKEREARWEGRSF